MKINSFHQKIKFYSEMTNKNFEINLKKNQYNKILLHILKANSILLVVTFVYLNILNTLSVLYLHKRFVNISNYELKKIKKFFSFFKFIVNKIDNFFGVISALHFFNNEKIKKKKIKNNSKHDYFRFIIIGSGPSGSATASKIIKKFPGQVAIIEKGNFFEGAKTKHPGEEFFNKWSNGGVNTTFWSERISFASGSCVGGGSEINSGLYHRPDNDFFKSWSKDYHIKNMTYDEMKPYINEVEKLVNYDVKTKNKKFENFFIKGADKLKIKYIKLKRFMTINSNLKNTMFRSYLKDFLLAKGTILSEIKVNKIYYDDNKWKMEVKTPYNNKIISCDYLFICCGSIHTNELLLRSKVIKRNSKVLKKFKFHPMIKSLAVYPEEVQELNSDISSYQITEFYPNYIIGNAASSIQFQLLPFYQNDILRKFIEKNWKKTKIFHTTFSIGKGKLVKIPMTDNYIASYKFNYNDKKKIYQGFEDQVKFIKSSGATTILPVVDKLIEPIIIDKVIDYKEIIKFKKKLEFSSVHIMGGVTSGENNKCIADSYGRIFDNKNLYVNDSSLINNNLLKNPQGTVLAIALRNVDFFLKNI